MPKQEKPPSLLMTQRELDTLAALPDRVKLALASPTCLSRQILTLLEQLQIALNAIAITGIVSEGSAENARKTTYSTLLDREISVYREMQFTKPVLSGNDGTSPNFVKWNVASSEHSEKTLSDDEPLYARKILLTASRKITLDWSQLEFGIDLSKWTFQRLEVWIDCREQDAESPMFWRHAVDSIRTALELCLELTPIVIRSETEDDYKNELVRFQDQYCNNLEASRALTRHVFNDFDARLKWLLKNHAGLNAEALHSQFLAQFFWVRSVGNPLANARRQKLSRVLPIFLSRQRELIREHLQRAKLGAPNTEIDRLMSDFDEGEMDSDSLFSAFPADTLMSTYIERWDLEKISEGDLLKKRIDEGDEASAKELELRKRFYRLTREIQESEVKSLAPPEGNDDNSIKDELILFSIPVLIDDRPIFVVQINTRRRLSATTRGVLSDAVHALGGVVIYRIHLYMLKEFENARKNALVRAALLELTKGLHDESTTVLGLLRDGVDTTSANQFLRSKTALLETTIECLIKDSEDLRLQSQNRLLTGNNKSLSFNLADAVDKAIAGIPMRLLHGMDTRTRTYHDRAVEVEGFEPGFMIAVQNIVINAAAAQADTEGGRLKIETKIAYFDESDSNEDDASSLNKEPRIQLSFINGGPGFKYSESVCLEKMSGLFQVKAELENMSGDLAIRSTEGVLGVIVSFRLPIRNNLATRN